VQYVDPLQRDRANPGGEQEIECLFEAGEQEEVVDADLRTRLREPLRHPGA